MTVAKQVEGPGEVRAAGPLPRVLVVDDEQALLGAMRRLLRDNFEVITLDDPFAALDLLREVDVDVMLADLRMPRMSGMELLTRAKQTRPDVEVIVMTAFATIETAIQAVRSGAFHYLTKPFGHIREVSLFVEKALEKRQLVHRARSLERELRNSAGFASIVGNSPAMNDVFRLIESVAATSANVLIEGETGTGKELIARAVHERSDRAHAPMVAVNCSALTETLLESELFGHKKGSFTGATQDKKGLFEAAHRGTLFLDETGDMALSTQVKLLRALQDGDVRPIGATASLKVDARVIAATNVDLQAAMKKGTFREDLYWRLNVIRIELPPLRKRVGDIPILAKYFLRRAAERFERPVQKISSEAMGVLVEHRWDGNVRELENVMERAVLLCGGDVVTPEDLPTRLSPPGEAPRMGRVGLSSSAHIVFRQAKDMAISTFERRYCEEQLEWASGNVSEAARRAGLDRANFRRLLTRHGIRAEDFRG